MIGVEKNALLEKVKDLVGQGHVEQARQFIEEHKEELGEHYEKAKLFLNEKNTSAVDKIKDFFHSK